jgi:hypothetical protein
MTTALYIFTIIAGLWAAIRLVQVRMLAGRLYEVRVTKTNKTTIDRKGLNISSER